MNSRNHFCLGAMAQWLYEDLAALKTLKSAPGLSHVRLAPRPAAGVSWLEFDYDTPYGTIRTHWKTEGDALIYDFTRPPNMTARVVLPGGETDDETYRSGTHTVRGRLDALSPIASN
jgi:alpha-L-rhamnosidase